MDSPSFRKAREDMRSTRNELLIGKGKEYREGDKDDVLENFKSLARELGISPMQVLCVYMLKHVRSITKFCKNPDTPMTEDIKFRIADNMNYLDLLFALAVEYQTEVQHQKDDPVPKGTIG